MQRRGTPAPWRVVVGVCKKDHPDTSADVVGKGEIHVANCGCHDDAKANARLIAAAPRMYEELAKADALLRQIEDFFLGMKRVNRPLWFDKVQDTIAGTSGALRKADGDA